MNETSEDTQLLENDIEKALKIMSYDVILYQSELNERQVLAHNSTGEYLIKYSFDNNEIIPEMLKRGLIEELDELAEIAFRAKTEIDGGDHGKFYRTKQLSSQ